MPYDRSLDEQVFTKAWENDTVRLTVSVFSYNKGAKKLQISRENKNEEAEYRFAKLGRLTKEEVEGIAPFIQEAISSL
jgi:hypothetical protein